jgi:hypothetical protein
LDLPTLAVLESFLYDFPGCVLIVSHDRYFMDRLLDHLLVFEGEGEIRDFPGNYTQYRIWLKENEKKDKKWEELTEKKSAGLSVMLFAARLTAASTRLSLRYLSIGPVNLGFGAAGTSDVVGSEHEQHVEFVRRLPVEKLRSSSSHSKRSGG